MSDYYPEYAEQDKQYGYNPSTHQCVWCENEVVIYYTTEATHRHNHFCTPICKRLFGDVSYRATEARKQVIRRVAAGLPCDPNDSALSLVRWGIFVRHAYLHNSFILTERGKRIYNQIGSV